MGTFLSHPFSWENKIMGIREVIGSYFIPRNLPTQE
jgi:hypothetical protein